MFTLDRKKFLSEEYLKKTFLLLDTDSSGTLELSEIKTLFDSINCGETIRAIWQ
jgi:Ca2+-binding EF-hand superfamily protein